MNPSLTFCAMGFFLSASLAQARVFSMGKENFAAYLRGTMGPKFSNTLMSSSSGSNVTLDSNHTSLRSGEFGFIYSSFVVNLRFGIEVLNPEDIKERVGYSSTSAEYFKIDSEMTVTTPKMAIEMSFYKSSISRAMLILGIGYANLVARNSYTVTTAGQSALGVTDFSEDLRATSISYEGGLGYELLFSDTTTLMLEAGYRMLNFTSIKHNKDVTTFQGAVVKGDAATDMNGNQRSLKLTNYFGGLTLRIWID